MKTATTIATATALTLGLGFANLTGADQNHYEPGSGGHLFVTPDELEWGEVGSMEGDAQMAVIEGDLSETEPFTFRLKLPEDYVVHPHTHPAYERVTVISGTFHFAHGEEFDRNATKALTEGSVAIMAPGEPMFGYTEEETVIQLHGDGPWGIEYVNPEHDPRE
ncbi:cupin domain-containing protein [Aquisalimonas sp.]|uniref:cupin domain-containing protein n=1 Tax=Aquisalimonas sp. TaxID=1872621 RepID=UPI0025BBA600|nr:cupin domain-containing protein [Aquisalimonas sp.]